MTPGGPTPTSWSSARWVTAALLVVVGAIHAVGEARALEAPVWSSAATTVPAYAWPLAFLLAERLVSARAVGALRVLSIPLALVTAWWIFASGLGWAITALFRSADSGPTPGSTWLAVGLVLVYLAGTSRELLRKRADR